MENRDLPDGWAWATLGEITQINGRDVAIRDLPDDLPVTFLPMSAVDAEQGIINQPEVRPLKDVRKGFTPFSDGDVLLAKITPSMENGKAAIARKLKNGRGFGSTEFHVFRPYDAVIPEWIFQFIRQENFRKDAKAHFAGTAGQLRVPTSFLVDYPIPVPPLREQKRIIAKIEELFTELDAGTAALERVQVGLKRYKIAILKSVYDGSIISQGKKIESDFDVPPAGWKWATIADLINEDGIFNDGDWIESKDQDPNGDVRLTQLADVGDGFFRNRSNRFLTLVRAKQLKCTFLELNDLLIARMPDPLGRACLFPGDEKKSVTVVDVCIVRTGKGGADPRWLMYTVNSPQFRSKIESYQSGSTRKRISRSNLAKIKLPLPPIESQYQIISEVEQKMSVLEELDKVLGKLLERSMRLRQAILKQAFEGKLVLQNPEDETAEKLLKRIKETRKLEAVQKKSEPRKKKEKRMSTVQKRQPLYETLMAAKGARLTPEQLIKGAGFDEKSMGEFYEELRLEIKKGRIMEERPNNKDVYLKGVKS